jgi:transposase
MTKPRKPTRKPTKRESYPDEFKVEAVKLADTVGTTQAASELKLQTSQIYSWRASIARKESTSKAESRLLSGNASLKRQLAEQKEEMAFLKKASAYFAKLQK